MNAARGSGPVDLFRTSHRFVQKSRPIGGRAIFGVCVVAPCNRSHSLVPPFDRTCLQTALAEGGSEASVDERTRGLNGGRYLHDSTTRVRSRKAVP